MVREDLPFSLGGPAPDFSNKPVGLPKLSSPRIKRQPVVNKSIPVKVQAGAVPANQKLALGFKEYGRNHVRNDSCNSGYEVDDNLERKSDGVISQKNDPRSNRLSQE